MEMAPILPSRPLDSTTFTQPRPRPPRSPAQSAQIRVHNRRREYINRHPEYLESLEHEMADPLLYDMLVRRFQSTAQREEEGRAKGYGRILEGSLARSEAREQTVSLESHVKSERVRAIYPDDETTGNIRYVPDQQVARRFAPDLDVDTPPSTAEEGREQWQKFLRERFIHGDDADFEYSTIDENDDYDVQERKDLEEAWYDAEDPGWATDGSHAAESDAPSVDMLLQGETGIQDY